ncbi:unnamed protein product [Danaus chrysippus]|uniref:(African queen) hypothetical protein n=1 Tax=Danaus chrysippus TaxID=151541 RepID=A0A8J2W806_9NEOP|nr:unnamed protein product [Danaus chrysippus]
MEYERVSGEVSSPSVGKRRAATTWPGHGTHLRIREGAPAGNRGVPGLLEYREVAARGAPAAPAPLTPAPLTPAHALWNLHPAFYARLNRELRLQ